MRAARSKHLPPAPAPEILIRLGLHLLQMAGAEPLAWHTVAEVAELLELDKESIRLAIRRGQFGGRLRWSPVAVPRAPFSSAAVL